MKPNFEENLDSGPNLLPEAKISEALSMNLRISSDSEDDDVKDEENEITDNHGGDAEEFTFMCGGANASPIAAEDAFANGQIKPIFPLFNRDLLFDSDALYENLPKRPPVKKVFMEARREDRQPTTTSSASENDEASGPYCEWSSRKAVEVSPEVCRKSNSTGFSKIWRFKDFLGRSNSDGRDAFVFLNNNNQPAPPPPSVVKGEEKSGKKEGKVTVKGGKAKKGTTTLSPHESYLRSKAAKKDDRRRSYLPYRPELMGFFTNINSGLTKNVHPF